MSQKLFQVNYKVFNSYDYHISYCIDCPTHSNSCGPCCKDDLDNWRRDVQFLELAESQEVMGKVLEGRRTPDEDYDQVTIQEVPYRMLQRWRRTFLLDFEDSQVRAFGRVSLEGDCFITDKWFINLLEKDHFAW